MSKPVIGIVMYPYTDKNKDMVFEVLTPVIKSVIKQGGNPIGIFPTQTVDFINTSIRNIPNLTIEEKNNLINSLNMCDGIIKPGAVKLYEFDRFIYNYTLEKNVPYLGICAGMQIMAAHGKERIENRKIETTNVRHYNRDDEYSHEVDIIKGTKLYDIIKEDTINVSSRHRYQVPNAGIHQVSALAPDGVIEAIENVESDFNMGLQWHPELMVDDETSIKIFNRFIDASNNYKKKVKIR